MVVSASTQKEEPGESGGGLDELTFVPPIKLAVKLVSSKMWISMGLHKWV